MLDFIDQLQDRVGDAIGPIRYEGNRRAIACAATNAVISGRRDHETAIRLARILGRHVLTQQRISWLSGVLGRCQRWYDDPKALAQHLSLGGKLPECVQFEGKPCSAS